MALFVPFVVTRLVVRPAAPAGVLVEYRSARDVPRVVVVRQISRRPPSPFVLAGRADVAVVVDAPQQAATASATSFVSR